MCQTIYSTECDTSQATTVCQQVERTICARDHCRLVEGEEECQEFLVENTIDSPEETCTMEPTQDCKNVTTRY